MIMLSILICTIPERKKAFNELCFKIGDQLTVMEKYHSSLGEIQICVDDGKSYLDGGLSIGKKRESLVKIADGKYICFLDDDEDIAPNYVETLVRLCQLDCDVVTFRSVAKMDNYWAVIDMSLKNEEDEEATPDRIVKRKPWHINAIRSKFAKLYEFPDTNYSEDALWMKNVLYHLESEAHTDAILHQYNHSSKTSESDKIIKAGHV